MVAAVRQDALRLGRIRGVVIVDRHRHRVGFSVGVSPTMRRASSSCRRAHVFRGNDLPVALVAIPM
jgi:hypothetical protein